MAWIRWRGTTAHLMATVWIAGKNRHRYLASLGGVYSVSAGTRAAVSANYPDLHIDWAAIDRALAQGPPGTRPLPPEAWDWAAVEHQLRDWAVQEEVLACERRTLEEAAEILQSWRVHREREGTP